MSSLTRTLKRKKMARMRAPEYFLTKVARLNRRKDLEQRYIQQEIARRASQPKVEQRQGR